MGKGNRYAQLMGMRPIPFKPRRPTHTRSALRRSPRLAAKLARSRTRTITKTKRKRKHNRSVKAGINGSTSFCRLGRRPRRGATARIAKTMGHRRTIADSRAGNSVCAIGKQQIMQFALTTAADLGVIRTAANAAVSTTNALKLYMFESKQKIHLRNQHNSLVTALIYDLTSKRVPFAAAVDTPQEAWERGLTDMGLAAGHSLNIHQTPQFSAEFRRHFNVQKVTKVLMEAGQQHEHSVFSGINRMVDTTELGDNAVSSMPGLTTWCMIVHYGSLAHETAAPSTVTYSPNTIDFAVFKADTWTYLESALPSYVLTNGLATTAVDLDMMGETGDADVNTVNA